MTSRTLLAHHWFFEPRGGERVLAELAALFSAALRKAFEIDSQPPSDGELYGWAGVAR